MKKVHVELCVSSLDEAVYALDLGIEHIELCAALEVGGLTPSSGFVQKVLQLNDIDQLRILIRAREGDFVFSPAEKDLMLLDMHHFYKLGVRKFVIGAFDENGLPDQLFVTTCRELFEKAELTFNRCIDQLARPQDVVVALKNYGIDRILTSGGMPSAFEGKDVIAEMVRASSDLDMTITAGAGINAENVEHIVCDTGVSEVHLSTSKTRTQTGLFGGDFQIDKKKVEKLIGCLEEKGHR